MTSTNIINVTEANFDFEVLEYSQNTPVLVDFWAEWSVPCQSMDPILRAQAQKAEGSFRLARLNVDESPKVAMRFNVRSVPAVKAFREGNIIAEFSGLKPEDEIRHFISLVVPSDADLILDKGHSLLRLERWEDAAGAFHQVLDERPHLPSAMIGLAKSLLALDQSEDALDIIDNFPSSREYATAQKLRPLALALNRHQDDMPSPIEATYQHAIRLIKLGNLPAAMDGILAVLRQDKHYRDDEARQVILGLFEILGENNAITRQYRQELASILF